MNEVGSEKSNRFRNASIVLLALSVLAIMMAPVAAAPAPPTFVTATTNTAGTVITITFSEAMARSISGAAHDFTFSVNGGRARSFRAAAINPAGSTMIDLTISGTPIAYGDSVTVSYRGRTVRAQNGGVLASFSNQPVTNALPAPPTFVSATTNAAGTVITITFSEAMANPARRYLYTNADQFTYSINGGRARSFRTIALNPGTNTMMDLTIGGAPIAYGDTVTVSYRAGTVRAQSGGVLASFSNEPVTNAVPAPPTFVSATTNTAGTVITVTFSEAMASLTPRSAYLFSYSVNGGRARPFRAAAINPDSNTGIDLTIGGTPIATGDTVTISYRAGFMRSQNGGVLASFSNEPVINAVQAPDVPVLYTVTYDPNGAIDGTIPIDPSTYVTGASVTVLGNTGGLVREAESGYTFIGWNTSPDGSGISYSPGDTFTMESADVTLFAQWAIIVYPE